jgi:hypothetical protein
MEVDGEEEPQICFMMALPPSLGEIFSAISAIDKLTF